MQMYLYMHKDTVMSSNIALSMKITNYFPTILNLGAYFLGLKRCYISFITHLGDQKWIFQFIKEHHL